MIIKKPSSLGNCVRWSVMQTQIKFLVECVFNASVLNHLCHGTHIEWRWRHLIDENLFVVVSLYSTLTNRCPVCGHTTVYDKNLCTKKELLCSFWIGSPCYRDTKYLQFCDILWLLELVLFVVFILRVTYTQYIKEIFNELQLRTMSHVALSSLCWNEGQ